MLDILRITAILVLPSLLGVFIFSQILVIKNRKPDKRLFELRLLYNPLFMQFLGRHYLTERAIFWRNVSWFCFVAYMAGMYCATTYLG